MTERKELDQKTIEIVNLEDLVEVLGKDYIRIENKLRDKQYIDRVQVDLYKRIYKMKNGF